MEERTGYAVSHTTVSSYESGGTVPVGYVLAVADAFDLEPRWLMSGEGEPRRNGLEDFFLRHPAPALAVDGDEMAVLETNEAFRREFGDGQDHGGR
ncbi:MAG: helix-turn-helix domain-containing protein, partial [Gemmatimonadota bacterium]